MSRCRDGGVSGDRDGAAGEHDYSEEIVEPGDFILKIWMAA